MRVNPEVTRQEILDAAVGVFCEVGFADADVRLIASRANVSETTIYRVFPAKSRTSFTSKHRIALELLENSNGILCTLFDQTLKDHPNNALLQLEDVLEQSIDRINRFDDFAVGLALRKDVVHYIEHDPLKEKVNHVLHQSNSRLTICSMQEAILGLLEHFANPNFTMATREMADLLKAVVRVFFDK